MCAYRCHKASILSCFNDQRKTLQTSHILAFTAKWLVPEESRTPHVLLMARGLPVVSFW